MTNCWRKVLFKKVLYGCITKPSYDFPIYRLQIVKNVPLRVPILLYLILTKIILILLQMVLDILGSYFGIDHVHGGIYSSSIVQMSLESWAECWENKMICVYHKITIRCMVDNVIIIFQMCQVCCFPTKHIQWLVQWEGHSFGTKWAFKTGLVTFLRYDHLFNSSV